MLISLLTDWVSPIECSAGGTHRMNLMKSTRLRLGVVIAAIALVAIGGVATLLLNSHRAPVPLALGSPTPGSAAGSLAGMWKVAAGSEAGYRVREQFINQPGPTEAVARTTKISGGLQLHQSGATLTATGLHFTADLSALQSQDQYANYKVYQRDFFIRSIYLQTDQFPNGDFTAGSVDIPATIESGPVSLSVAGMLKVHGVTKPVTTQLQVQLNGSNVEAAGSINVDMRDFGVDVPDISFTKAEPQVVIEYHLVLVRA
jgi:polyisoprenoid-binding protein YceI